MVHECTGEENHDHYNISSDATHYHTHKHSVVTQDFNRLHHHPPIEHEGLTQEELENELTIDEVPF
jgi:hypothetical protein